MNPILTLKKTPALSPFSAQGEAQCLLNEVKRSGIGLWQWGVDDNSYQWSEEMFRLHDLTGGSDIPAKDFFAKIPPYDQEQIKNLMADAVAHQTKYENTHRTIWANGEVHYIKASGGVHTDNDGKKYFCGTATDVTELYRKNTEILQKTRYYRTLLDQMPSAVIVIDGFGVIHEINGKLTSALGYDRTDLIGKNVNQLMPEPFKSEHNARIRKFSQTGVSHIIGKGRFVPVVVRGGALKTMFLLVEKFTWEVEEFYIGSLNQYPSIHYQSSLGSDLQVSMLLKAIPSWMLVVNLHLEVLSVYNEHLLFGGFRGVNLVGKKLSELSPETSKANISNILAEMKMGLPEILSDHSFGFSGQLTGQQVHYLRISDDKYLVFNEDLSSQQSALEEKMALLKEIVHRVKNNFQVLDSILGLHSVKLEDPTARELCLSMRKRIYSLGLVQDYLYRSKDFAHIDLHSYLEKLVTTGFSMNPGKFIFRLSTTPCSIDMEADAASRCGSIINELVSNSIRHAFEKGQATLVSFWLERIGNDKISLYYFDDGPYYQHEAVPTGKSGIGSFIISSFVETLRGVQTRPKLSSSGLGSLPAHIMEDQDYPVLKEIHCFCLTFSAKGSI